MLVDAFVRGILMLKDYDLRYDLLLYPRHLHVTVKFLQSFPEQRVVLDYIENPNIAKRQVFYGLTISQS